MKPLITVFFVFLTVFIVSAQTSNLVVFSDDGQAFTAYVNGEQLNASPQTNVKKTDILGEGVKVRIVFANAIPELSKYVMLTPNEEMTLSIAKNKKGQYTFKVVSSAPITAISKPIAYSEPVATAVVSPDDDMPSNVNTSTTTMQSTTVTNQVNANTSTVSMSSNMGMPANANVNITINANVQEPVIHSTTTTTTTSTTSSTTPTVKESTIQPSTVKSEGKNWESCALDGTDYESALSSIRSKSFSDAKMTVAKQVLKNSCVTTKQVKGMAQLFQYEEDKLAFVKYAYDYTSDKKNFYQVNDVFTFETTIDELNKYLEAKN